MSLFLQWYPLCFTWLILIFKNNIMNLVKTNNLFFPHLMNDLLGPDWFGGSETRNSGLPAVNIRTEQERFVLELAVPGATKSDFEIAVDEKVLTISSEVKKDSESETGDYTRKEFSFSAFSRSFTLPDTVDDKKIEASYKAGILRVTLPKLEEALPEPKRRISIG